MIIVHIIGRIVCKVCSNFKCVHMVQRRVKMKKQNLVLVFMLVMLLTNVVWAQMPQKFNYQAKLTNSAGEPLTGEHSFDFAFVDEYNYVLWQTQDVIISVEDGLYSVVLGDDYLSDAYYENNVWLRVTVDNELLSPNQQILPVLHAHRAGYADFAENASTAYNAEYAQWAQGAEYASAAAGNFYVSQNLQVTGAIICYDDIDAGGNIIAGGHLHAGGNISADGVKNFVIDHPLRNDKKIVYACIEGPEAAVYTRGTAELINGEAWITFEEHFELVVNPETITVQLTSLSAESEGLAVVEKTANGFRIKELRKGTGNYKFDYFVQGIRKGYEDYRVIRDKSEYESKNKIKN